MGAAARVHPFPKLVLSGGHSPVFEQVCDATARELGAERDTIRGRGHTIPACGTPYNERSSGSCAPRPPAAERPDRIASPR